MATEIRAGTKKLVQSPVEKISSAGIVRKIIMSLKIVINCRTRRKGTVPTNRKIRKISPMVLVRPLSFLPTALRVNASLFLLLVLPVRMNGFLIQHIIFIFVVTRIDLVLMSLCRLEILCVWAMTILVILLAGSVQIKTHDGMTRTLKEVKHIPSMPRNLISLSTMDCDGYKYTGERRLLKVSRGSLIHMIGDMNSAKLYVLRGSTFPSFAAVVTPNDSDDCAKTNMWHMRLGHMSEHGMAELVKRELIDGCNLSKLEFCEHCVYGKHKRVKFIFSVHTTKGILYYVHADVWGPSRKISIGGANCMLTIIDDYSRKVWPYFLKHKSDVFGAFKKWKAMVENQTERKVNFCVLIMVVNLFLMSLRSFAAMMVWLGTTRLPVLHNKMAWLSA